MVERHSILANNAYLELKTALLDEQVTGLRGSPKLKIVNGRSYWYDQYYIGNRAVETYIGEDTPELS